MTPQRKKQLTWVFVVFVCVVCVDQATKAWIDHTIPLRGVSRHDHEREFFWLTHERNPGMVFGTFGGSPVIAKIAPILATGVLGFLFFHLDAASRFQSLAYGLVAGGAIGNLIDRIVRGEVVDFIQVHFWFINVNFPGKYYPAFNVADSCICVGVVLLILGWHRAGKTSEEPSNAAHAR